MYQLGKNRRRRKKKIFDPRPSCVGNRQKEKRGQTKNHRSCKFFHKRNSSRKRKKLSKEKGTRRLKKFFVTQPGNKAKKQMRTRRELLYYPATQTKTPTGRGKRKKRKEESNITSTSTHPVGRLRDRGHLKFSITTTERKKEKEVKKET